MDHARRNYSKYEYSIKIRHLPESWARTCPLVHSSLLEMLQSHTSVCLHRPSTSENYATRVKKDGRAHCYVLCKQTRKMESNSSTTSKRYR